MASIASQRSSFEETKIQCLPYILGGFGHEGQVGLTGLANRVSLISHDRCRLRGHSLYNISSSASVYPSRDRLLT